MKVKDGIKIREEDGFYLLINLSEDSILKGYPSFFKINNQAKQIIEFMRNDVEEDDVIRFCSKKNELDTNEIQNIANFILFLRRADLVNE